MLRIIMRCKGYLQSPAIYLPRNLAILSGSMIEPAASQPQTNAFDHFVDKCSIRMAIEQWCKFIALLFLGIQFFGIIFIGRQDDIV